MNTIQEKWDDFRKHCLPENAPEWQLKSMKRAFYAGSCTTYQLIMDLHHDNSEDATIAILEGIGDEYDLYHMQIRSGEA